MALDERLREAAVVRLRSAGLRVTAPRIGTLVALERHPHSDADAVAGHVRATLGAVSTQAVYDVLHALTEARLVRCIQPAGSTARYETRVGDNHHHMICRGCGVVVDVECVGEEPPCLVPDASLGFVLDEAEVTFWGYCPACQAITKENG